MLNTDRIQHNYMHKFITMLVTYFRCGALKYEASLISTIVKSCEIKKLAIHYLKEHVGYS